MLVSKEFLASILAVDDAAAEDPNGPPLVDAIRAACADRTPDGLAKIARARLLMRHRQDQELRARCGRRPIRFETFVRRLLADEEPAPASRVRRPAKGGGSCCTSLRNAEVGDGAPVALIARDVVFVARTRVREGQA